MLIDSAIDVIAPFASFLPLTKSIFAFRVPSSSIKDSALLKESLVFSRSNISILFLTPYMKGFVDGCRLDLMNPKCAPAVNRPSTRAFAVLEVSVVFVIRKG